jgi:hypothetical protein
MQLISSKVNSKAPPRLSELFLGVPLTGTLAIVCLLMLAAWLPHYLTWPWWIDIDALAAVAQEWDLGIVPYRDVSVFNFPGQIELLWLVGKCFGWGRTMPIYALDAALLVTLGVVMSAWSRCGFNRVAPGLVGYIAFLHYYLSLDYALVAQRDWHGPLLVVLGMMGAQAWSSWSAAIGSGLLFGMAFVIRPHVLLFTPAAALAVAMPRPTFPAGSDLPSQRRTRNRRLAFWALGAFTGVAVGFAPLAVQGLLGVFVRGLGQASQGRYGQYPESPAWIFIRQFANWQIALGSVLAVAVVLADQFGVRRLALPWVLLLLLVMIYRPLHPFAHAYLAHPLWLVLSINLAVTTGWVFTTWKDRPMLALGSLGILLAIASPGVPRFCDVAASLSAIGDIGKGIVPVQIPLGAATHFAPLDSRSPYNWEQYREVLAYLRLRTDPQTQVANLLRNVPFPGVNGSVGRISPLRADAGIIWLYQLDAGRELDFARLLEAAEDTVVVWIPGERSFDPRLQIPVIERTVTQFYRPEAKLSGIQIWRRTRHTR